MKAFDFDNTIYKGESTFDFALYVVKRKKSLIRYLPAFLWLLFTYKVARMEAKTYQKKLDKYAKQFLTNKDFILECVQGFWEENIDRLYPHMLKMIHEDDVIITTCPDFLINEIRDIIPTDHILSTQTDLEKGRILFLNFHENKVKAYHKYYANQKIENFYTDSQNDKPLMAISKNVFLVKNGVVKRFSK